MTGGSRPLLATALLAFWLGGAALFAGVVARAAFAVLPSRALAGALVGRVLPVVFVAGIAAGLAFAMLARSSPLSARIAACVSAVACAIAQFAIAPRIARVRAAIGSTLDALPPTDARRIEFGRLHAISVGWLALAMLAATVAVVLVIVATRRTDAPSVV